MRVIFFLATLLVAALAKYKGGKDLDPSSDLRIGTIGAKPADCTRTASKGDKLSMHYTGTLYKDGSQFDSSVGRGPFDFTLGTGQVIKASILAPNTYARLLASIPPAIVFFLVNL